MSLTQIYIKFRTIICTLLQPNGPLYNNNTAFTTISSSLMMKKKFQPATILSAFTEPFRAHNGVSTRKYRFCHRRREFSLFTMHTRPKWSVLVSYITIFSAILLGNINKPVVKTHSLFWLQPRLLMMLFVKKKTHTNRHYFLKIG